MSLVIVENTAKSYADRTLFEDVSFSIARGEKIALIGVNGAGKSTLMRIVAGKEDAESGSVITERGCRISFLTQVPAFNKDDTIEEHLFTSDEPEIALIRKYEACCAALAKGDEGREGELERLTEEMHKKDVWQYEREIRTVLSRLGIDDLTLRMGALSGGMAKKVALAQTLIARTDLIILDEPTNHLDIDTITWLEEELAKRECALLFVTHDRYFLDRVATSIIELDRKGLTRFEGNYTYYLEKKAEMENALVREEERVQSVLRRELAWLKRGPQARSLKQKARKDRIDDLLDRETYSEGESVEISVRGRRLGKKVLELQHVTKAFDENTIIEDFTYSFKRGERVGIVGKNGSGKTTFLNLLTGRLTPDSGVIDVGVNTHFGYFDQHSSALKTDLRVLEYLRDVGEYIELENGKTLSAAKMLERFLFPPAMHYTYVNRLSGGEKRRLYLLSILMRNPNFLILDEPTNDLDIKTLAVFEEFLTEYAGCLILVSHDRYFMDRVVEYVLAFEGEGRIANIPGNYSDYLELQNAQEKEEADAREEPREEKAKRQERTREKKKLSYNEQREFAALEKEIEALEDEKREIEDAFAKGDADAETLQARTVRYAEVERALDKKFTRWEELADFAG